MPRKDRLSSGCDPVLIFHLKKKSIFVFYFNTCDKVIGMKVLLYRAKEDLLNPFTIMIDRSQKKIAETPVSAEESHTTHEAAEDQFEGQSCSNLENPPTLDSAKAPQIQDAEANLPEQGQSAEENSLATAVDDSGTDMNVTDSTNEPNSDAETAPQPPNQGITS